MEVTSLDTQQRHVESMLLATSPDRRYVFGLLIVERMCAVSMATFPHGLPTKNIPYADVADGVEHLWRRPRTVRPFSELSASAKQWRPLTRGGKVQSKKGASLGFFIAESIAKLAVTRTDDPTETTDVAYWVWEAMTSLLFRVPQRGDFSQRVSQMPLEPTLNQSLLIEFRVESVDFENLALASVDYAALRARSQHAAKELVDSLDTAECH